MNPYLRQPLTNKNGLGMTVMTQDANFRQAVTLGTMEGVSDVARWFTLGLAATAVFFILPKKWTAGIRRQVRRIV